MTADDARSLVESHLPWDTAEVKEVLALWYDAIRLAALVGHRNVSETDLARPRAVHSEKVKASALAKLRLDGFTVGIDVPRPGSRVIEVSW